jgi:hypothetical protein
MCSVSLIPGKSCPQLRNVHKVAEILRSSAQFILATAFLCFNGQDQIFPHEKLY